MIGEDCFVEFLRPSAFAVSPLAPIDGGRQALHAIGHRFPLPAHTRFARVVACALGLIALVVALADVTTVAADNPTPPAGFDIQITPSRDAVEQGESLPLFFIITNKSSTDVRDLTMTLTNDDFSLDERPSFPASLAGFSSVQGTIEITPKATAPFAQDRVLFTFAYTSSVDGREIRSLQGSVVTIGVTRRFEEESKGFLGGNGAFLYLLLPIIPLFLGYQLVAHRRREGTFALPSFNTDYIVPAFLLAVALNLLLLIIFRQLQIDYQDPVTALGVLVGSFLLGAVGCGVSWGVTFMRDRKWTYQETDSLAQYLCKALLRPDCARSYEWVTGTSGGESWQGILLHQPTGAVVLGARLQASPADPSDANWQMLTQNILGENGTPFDVARVVELVESHALTLTYQSKVTQGEVQQDAPVATTLKEFAPTTRELQPLLILTH